MNLYSHAILFAGGKSSRMGKDKALLPFGGYPTLAQYQHEKLKHIFHTVSISAKKNKFDFVCDVITDNYKISSPLVGILSAFETFPERNALFILSVDAPFVEKTIIRHLMEKDSKQTGADVVIAQTTDGIQPLCGLYKRSILPFAYTQYKKNNHKLQDLLALAKTEIVFFKETEAFTNLNYQEEYKKALIVSLKNKS